MNTQTSFIKIPVKNKTPGNRNRCDIKIKINNESKINDFISNQNTLVMELFDGELMVLNKSIDQAQRPIVATNKERNLSTKLDIAKMKLNKFVYNLSVDMSYFFKKHLVIKYDFYLKMTTYSKVIKSINIFLLNFFLRLSKMTKNVSLKKQKFLLDNNYYYKEKVFSDAQLYTISKEIAHEIVKKQLKLTIKNIQNMFSISSYRQARKIYLFIKNNNLIGGTI